jgi:hypothetical protein
MPYKIKRNNDGTYQVMNAITGKVHAKSASKEDAEKQVRLMKGIDHGWKPRHRWGKR